MTQSAKGELAAIPEPTKTRLEDIILGFQDSPFPLEVWLISDDHYALVCEGFRILYTVFGDDVVVYAIKDERPPSIVIGIQSGAS